MSKDGIEIVVKQAAEKTPPDSPFSKGGEKKVDTDAVVDGWLVEYFSNSPIARSDECWLLLHRAVKNLKQRLKGDDHG